MLPTPQESQVISIASTRSSFATPPNANMCRLALALGIILAAGCNSGNPQSTDIEPRMTEATPSASDTRSTDASTSNQTVRLAGDRTIHLPTNRTLVPVGDRPVTIDLATSQISGLIIHEPEKNVVRVLGQPDDLADADRRYLYSSRGMSVVLIGGNVHALDFWLSLEAVKERLAFEPDASTTLARIEKDFAPSNAQIVGRGIDSLRLRKGLSREDIVSTLGPPDKVTDWPDGGTSLTYFGRVPEGDYDRLHLDFSLKSGELRSVYLTH